MHHHHDAPPDLSWSELSALCYGGEGTVGEGFGDGGEGTFGEGGICAEDLVVRLDVGGVFGGDVRVGGGAGGGLGAGWGVFLRVFVFLTALGLLLRDTLGLSGSFVTGVRGELVDVF